VFLYRNLSKAERVAVSKDHPEVDWSTFPPATDEVDVDGKAGPFYLEQFFNEFSDNSKQDSFHTASGIQAGILNFVKSRPWLDEKRRCFLQSDGAVNYHEPTTEVDLYWIGTRCFSEPGEGKDWIDANSALVKCQMRRQRNKGFFQQNAFQYFKSAEEHVIIGNTNCVIEIDASKDKKVTINKMGKKRVCVPGIRNFALFNVTADTITFWEYLDYLASEASMETGGPAVGYGRGMVMKLTEFNAIHRTRHNFYDAKIVEMGSTEKSTRGHRGEDEKEEKKRAKLEKKEKYEADKKRREDDALAVQRCEDKGQVYPCPRCQSSFKTDEKLQTHIIKGACVDKAAVSREKDEKRNIVAVLSAKAAEAR
jgi:hypothetical protein